MSLIITKDILFNYTDPNTDPQLIFSTERKNFISQAIEKGQTNFIHTTPFVLIPEEISQNSISLALDKLKPYQSDIQMALTDTWYHNYTKCEYVSDPDLAQPDGNRHLISYVADYAKNQIDRVENGIFALKLEDHLYLLIYLDRRLQTASRHYVPYPDDTAYFLVRWLDKFRNRQNDFTLWTNEKQISQTRILQKFIPEVKSYTFPGVHHALNASSQIAHLICA